MIANRRSLEINFFEEIVHDLAVTDQLRRLNASLELIARIQIQSVILELLRYDAHQRGHIREPSVVVLF